MKILGLLGKTTDEGLSGLSRLWDELTGGITDKTAALRAEGEALRPQTGSLGEGTGVARDYLSPQKQAELDQLVADKFKLNAMRTQGYSPEYAGGLLKFGEEGMTQEARMARAAEQGFEGPFYRWTEGGQGRVVRTPEVDTGLKFGPAGYASPQPDYGARYVDPTKSNVQPLMARGPLADLNEVDRVSQGLIAQRKEAGLPQWPGHQQHWAEMQDALKAEGYRGVRYGDKEVASFEPEKNMRSVNAVFDPEGKGGLLSGVGGATVLGGGLLGGSEDAEAGVGSKILGQISETGFFSPLERAVGGLSQQKGTGDQMLAMIQKQAGVKPEEVQWTGLGDFLAGKPSVTKSEIEDYLLNNRVELKEVSLESVNPYPYKTGDEWQAAVSAAERRRDWDEVERLHNAWEAEQGHGPAGTPKFERYSTPGGSNYRELLMTMPEREPRNLNDIAQEMFGKRFSDLGDSEANKVVTAEQSQKRAENYRSGHYDQPNILAHTRVKDYEQDGQKILHVDEVQSDWHQAGRKQGYASQKEVGYIDAQIKRLSEKRSDLADDNEIMLSSTQDQGVVFADRTMEIDGDYPVLAIVDKYGNFYPGENMRADKLEKIQKYANIRKELYKLREKRFAIASGVPDAPFKKNWHELMTRRILQEAADKGYSRVTFTTGRTQADRYDLRKSIEEIHYSGSNLTAYDKQGNAVIQQTGIREADLPDLIGKEAAEKLLNQPKQGTLRSLVGQELEVGGEGMKGFYDNMMVKAFNKEGKKFGVKVEPYKLRAGREVSWEEWMAQEHPNVRPMDIIGTPREAQLDAEYEAFLKNGGGEQVWSMEIPPEMRAKKKAEGSPMFAAAPFGLLGAGAMTPDKDAQAAMIAENIRQTPLSAFDLNRKPQAEMRAPRYGLLADIADAFEAGSRNDLLGSGESAARVANALAYGQRPGVLDTIVGSFEAIDPITWASLFGAMSKGR